MDGGGQGGQLLSGISHPSWWTGWFRLRCAAPFSALVAPA